MECSSPTELLSTTVTLRASCAICELPGEPHASRRTVRLLRRLVHAAPDLAVVVVCTLRCETALAITAAGNAGVGAVTLHQHDNIVLAVRRALRTARFNAAIRRTMTELAPHLSATGHRILRCCLYHAQPGATVSRIASALGMCRRTLERQCHGAGLPLPEELIGWCRLVMVEETTRGRYGTLERVCKRVGFQGAADMRTKLKRRTGLTLQQARESGGLTKLFKERFLLQRRAPELDRLRVIPLDVEVVDEPVEQFASS